MEAVGSVSEWEVRFSPAIDRSLLARLSESKELWCNHGRPENKGLGTANEPSAELVRAQKGDGEAGAFCHDVSRALLTERADISKREVIVPIAERFGISASDVETAWHERRFSPTVDAFIKDGHKAGVRGVPAMGWPNRRAIVGLMPPTELVLRLRNEAPDRLRE
jgi:predicted DsbA family dithiol-disulfide isomerase